jgi:5,10-methylenetetrahydromethanopterin reductase
MCVAATQRIKLGTGVTNPVTRDAAVLASAFSTLQQESGGRMMLGIGRGDSSLAHIGKSAAPLADLESFIVSVQGYLRGESVKRDGFPSRLLALSALPKVPVDVAGTGKRVIALAARRADGLTLAVGAHPERIAAKVREAEAALAAAGRSRAGFTTSAYVNVAVNDHLAVARDIARGGAAITARFSGMHGGAASDGLSADEGRAVLRLADSYDLGQHGSSAAPHARALTDAFLDSFAVIGDAARVTERLAAIAATGIDRIVLICGSLAIEAELIQQSIIALSRQVLPALRR